MFESFFSVLKYTEYMICTAINKSLSFMIVSLLLSTQTNRPVLINPNADKETLKYVRTSQNPVASLMGSPKPSTRGQMYTRTCARTACAHTHTDRSPAPTGLIYKNTLEPTKKKTITHICRSLSLITQCTESLQLIGPHSTLICRRGWKQHAALTATVIIMRIISRGGGGIFSNKASLSEGLIQREPWCNSCQITPPFFLFYAVVSNDFIRVRATVTGSPRGNLFQIIFI